MGDVQGRRGHGGLRGSRAEEGVTLRLWVRVIVVTKRLVPPLIELIWPPYGSTRAGIAMPCDLRSAVTVEVHAGGVLCGVLCRLGKGSLQDSRESNPVPLLHCLTSYLRSFCSCKCIHLNIYIYIYFFFKLFLIIIYLLIFSIFLFYILQFN